jgi:hypothetical protein
VKEIFSPGWTLFAPRVAFFSERRNRWAETSGAADAETPTPTLQCKICRAEKIDMRTSNTKKKTETRLLCAITLTCYVTTLAGLLVMGYTVFSLATRALEDNILAAYSYQIF